MYKLPDIKTLLPTPPTQGDDVDDVLLKAEMLEVQLQNFKVDGIVVDTHVGPVITQYEIKLGKGVSASKVEKISKDVAIAMCAERIRVVAPIPGRNTIGIEIPNSKPQTVFIKEVLENADVSGMKIPLVLGKTVSGKYRVMDLAKAPHLLVAGQTGAGKSVGVNSFIASILAYKTPEEVKLILIDPKMVELKPYENVPHVLGNVVTDSQEAVERLKWTVEEMERRYRLLSKSGVRNLESYNKNNESLPYIVVIIDELADLMMTTGKLVEQHIVRIAQKARAVGIHLILTTQRPDMKVITGLIKSNLPARIGFKVASQIDARTIMDNIGCEKLLGNGDMLLKMPDKPDPERIHGSFISDDECKVLIEACESQQAKEVVEEVIEEIAQEKDVNEDIRNHPKYNKAVILSMHHNRISESFLQRHLDIGYDDSKVMVKMIKILS